MVNKFTAMATAAALATAVIGVAAASPATQVHVHTSDAAGFNTNSVWIDDGREVTVVDSQFTPALARALVADIGRQTRSPITRVIVTHPNPDKFNGLSVFHEAGAVSISTAATAAQMPGVHAYKQYFWVNIAKAFTADTYPRLELPKRTFSGKLVVDLKNGDTLSLIELAQGGVSGTQTVVRIDSTGDLIVGDLVANRTHAWLEGGVDTGKPVFNLAAWRASLQQLPGLAQGHAQARLFAGRGPVLPVAQAVQAQLDYLKRAESAVTAEEAALGARRTDLYDAAKQGPSIARIQGALAADFPDYAMPDLVGYSLYGWLATRGR
jgi:glyoxylase-like metal-dependent hydrolase (beta-lactamase superfamily II)